MEEEWGGGEGRNIRREEKMRRNKDKGEKEKSLLIDSIKQVSWMPKWGKIPPNSLTQPPSASETRGTPTLYIIVNLFSTESVHSG